MLVAREHTRVAGSDAATDVHVADDTVLLYQRQMAELFAKDVDTIGLHIRNIYKQGELNAEATTNESPVVQDGG